MLMAAETMCNNNELINELFVRARGADGHLGIDKGLAGVCPAISVVTAT
jgi:hypothetical protein